MAEYIDDIALGCVIPWGLSMPLPVASGNGLFAMSQEKEFLETGTGE